MKSNPIVFEDFSIAEGGFENVEEKDRLGNEVCSGREPRSRDTPPMWRNADSLRVGSGSCPFVTPRYLFCMWRNADGSMKHGFCSHRRR